MQAPINVRLSNLMALPELIDREQRYVANVVTPSPMDIDGLRTLLYGPKVTCAVCRCEFRGDECPGCGIRRHRR